MIVVWNDGEVDNYFTGKINNTGYVWSSKKEDAQSYYGADDLGSVIEDLLCENFEPLKVFK